MMFPTEFHGSDAARLTAAADAVFTALVDIDHPPEWNARIHHVIESPASASPVAEGTEWVVQMRASGGRWPSRSRALVVDPVAHRFEYETHTDDGNPTSALWSWPSHARRCRLRAHGDLGGLPAHLGPATARRSHPPARADQQGPHLTRRP
jgi:Polyketide cyclase / dehydrase and lipid transport